MSEENLSQEFRLKKIYETRNYFIKEINQNELMSKKNKKVSRILIYTEHLIILISTVTGCVSTFAFASLAGVPIGNASPAVGLKIDSNISHGELVLIDNVLKEFYDFTIWRKKLKMLMINKSLNYI